MLQFDFMSIDWDVRPPEIHETSAWSKCKWPMIMAFTSLMSFPVLAIAVDSSWPSEQFALAKMSFKGAPQTVGQSFLPPVS